MRKGESRRLGSGEAGRPRGWEGEKVGSRALNVQLAACRERLKAGEEGLRDED
jgi:hypothetical protein